MADAPAPRPRVGLVLSGGGARGYAHLGVLRVLERNRIPIDYVAATSMGAVVGGLYASGRSIDDLIDRLSRLDLTNIAFDRNERAQLSQALREDEYEYPIGISAGYGDGKVKLPTGFVQGNRFLLLLQEWTAHVPGNIDFDRLPVPFRAVATDLEKGDEVVLYHGSLPHAIRASMAAPGLFTPIKIDGRTLVDGGLVGNLPVRVAHQMGADMVIAVDIGAPLRKIDDINTPLAVTEQMLGILIGQNVQAQRQLLTERDMLIRPALDHIGFSDFSRAAEAIAAGEAAANAMLPMLSKLALDSREYAAFRDAQLARVSVSPVRIDRIEIVTSGRVTPEFVRRYLDVRQGDVFDPTRVRQSIEAISTAGYFDSVSYELIETRDGNTLRIEANGATWGPNIFLFGLSLNTNFDGDGAFRFSIGHRYPWLTETGLEWRNDIVLGSDLNRYATELRHPLPGHGDFYVAAYGEIKRQKHNLFLNDLIVSQPANSDPFAQYQLRTFRAGIDVGIPVKRLGELRVGLAYANFVDTPKSSLPCELVVGCEGAGNFLPVSKSRLLGPRARLVLDQLDDVLFPRSGYYVLVENETSLLGQGNNYSETHVKGLWATGIGGHSFNFALEAGGDFNVGQKAQPPGFFLGGFQHLSAYAPDQFAGNFVLYGRVSYLTPVFVFDAPPFRTLFFGLSAEAGNVWINENEFGQGPYKQSYSAFVGLTSSLGPIYLGAAFAPNNTVNIYFQLGRPF